MDQRPRSYHGLEAESRSAPPPELEGEVHLWLAFPDTIREPGLLARFQSVLDPAEKMTWGRFRFERHRHQYLVAHALLRWVLSRYAPVAPAAWHFERGAYGRPEISRTPCSPPLRFNISHTNGLVACAVASDADIGVDVEEVRRGKALLEIASVVFSDQEAAALRCLPKERRVERFFDYWTLKEAYIKARGMGLALPLKGFSFCVTDGEPLRIGIDPELKDAAESWSFFLLQPTARHRAALASRCVRKSPRLRVWTCIPFCGEGEISVKLLARS